MTALIIWSFKIFNIVVMLNAKYLYMVHNMYIFVMRLNKLIRLQERFNHKKQHIKEDKLSIKKMILLNGI